MPVTITWDDDAPITGQPDAGTNSKVYAEAGAGTVTVTDEAIGGESQTLNYTVPLGLTTVEAVPNEVNSGGDEGSRTTVVAGENFPASTSGTVAIATGLPNAYGTTVVATGASTNADGIFTGASLTVPLDLAAGDYHIEATFGDIGDLSEALTVVHVVLAAPANLASPSQTASTVDLTWDAVTNADTYVVRWSPAGAGTWTELAPVATTSDTVTGLDASTSYDFQVKSQGAGFNDSDWSATLTQATEAQPQLATPTNLAAGVPTADTVPLTWDAVVNAETYTVAWRPTGGTFTEIPGIATTSTDVTGLDPDTEYEFRVKAVAEGFTDSEWSTIITATTDTLGTLAAPTNVASPSQTATTIDVTWDAVTNAEMYVVRWSPAGAGTWTELAPVATTSDTVTGLTASTSYDIEVKATATGWTDSPQSATLTQSTTA